MVLFLYFTRLYCLLPLLYRLLLFFKTVNIYLKIQSSPTTINKCKLYLDLQIKILKILSYTSLHKNIDYTIFISTIILYIYIFHRHFHNYFYTYFYTLLYLSTFYFYLLISFIAILFILFLLAT